ncbi:hypothetical protein [Janthinobacterium sp. CG3]|uniref:hypothetical protein n=1 Tax=Janthinobacterium sp. CG3 TaxID=1075768 RepID=UPI00034A7C11|nr:hypothetical protein [Janthinobacterium sp. CG3]
MEKKNIVEVKDNPRTAERESMEIVHQAIELQVTFLAYREATAPQDKARVRAALDGFRLIGQTAAFFGHYKGMLALNNAIVAAGGDSY